MATLTIIIDNQTVEWVRSVAAREQTDETLVAARILERVAKQSDGTQDTPQHAPDDSPSQEMRQKQIRQIFERNEWC